MAAARPLPAGPRGAPLRVLRPRLAGGARTTVYVAEHDARRTDVRVAVLGPPRALAAWCRAHGHQEAIVGGFFARPGGTPLGELRTGGIERAHVPFAAPWGARRACVHVDGGRLRLTPRSELSAAPRGDLLQAGPLLVRDGAPCLQDGDDAEGFSAASGQFDSDITVGRYPRAALGVAGSRLLAVACDGRDHDDAGLSLPELAHLMAELGARHAINLDGGGSTSLVTGGRLRNVPREQHGRTVTGGRAVSTALLFVPRA